MTARKAESFRGRLVDGKLVLEFDESEAVALTPATAQRLAIALEEALRRRPRDFAAAPQASPDRSADLALRGETPLNAPPDAAAALGARLLSQVQALGAPFRYERSFRMAPGSLLANRFLLTVVKSDLGDDPLQRVSGICRALQMPAALEEAAAAHFAGCGAVHFGFEGAADGVLLKLYLEQAIATEEAERARAAGQPLLQHIAFKWDPAQGQGVTTRYVWHPLRSRGELDARLQQLYRDPADAVAARLAGAVVDIAAQRLPAQRLQYLEVEEDGNGRRSFDLNLYDAALKVQDLQAVLGEIRDHFGLRPGQFQALYDQVRSRPLGHVAGGTHRNGAGFFNIYHAAA
jgi:hypothetical protein